MKRMNEEMKWKNEEEILVLWKENEEMKKKLVEGGPSDGLGNPTGKSFTTPPILELLRSQKQSTPRRLRMSPI